MHDFAVREMDIIGLTDEDEMNGSMRKHILHMVDEFRKEGHSGFSASYALSILKNILEFKPLSPLTGEDSEWNDVAEYSPGYPLFQNNRYGCVFKEGKDGAAYNIEGRVFWDWYTDPETEESHKSYYTCKDSRINVTFPYTVPEKPEYVYRVSEAE